MGKCLLVSVLKKVPGFFSGGCFGCYVHNLVQSLALFFSKFLETSIILKS